MKGWLKRGAWILGLLVLLVILAIPRIPGFETPDTETERTAAPVRVFEAESSSLERSLRLTGTLRADESAEIRAEITAKVKEILLAEGEPVRKGDLLVKLEDEDVRADLEQVEANLEFALREEERQRRLIVTGSTTERLFEEAANRRRVLEANKRSIETRLAKTELRAPFDGVIGLRDVSPGSLVQPDTRVASLRKIDPLKIDFSAPERYLADLRVGLPFEVTLAGSDATYSGSVYAREPAIDSDTRTVRLRGRVENPEGRLLPGAFAQVHLTLGHDDEAILIPSVAIIPGQESSVFVIDNGRAQRRTVDLGRRTRDKVQILNGIEAGDTVVIAGVQSLRDGEEVTILGPDET